MSAAAIFCDPVLFYADLWAGMQPADLEAGAKPVENMKGKGVIA